MSIPNYDARIASAPEPQDMAGCRAAWHDMARDQIEELAEKIVEDTLQPMTDSPEESPTNRWAWETRTRRSLCYFTSPETLAHIAHGWGLIPDYETFAQDWTERQAEAAYAGRAR